MNNWRADESALHDALNYELFHHAKCFIAVYAVLFMPIDAKSA
jgi:hypothetical protein